MDSRKSSKITLIRVHRIIKRKSLDIYQIAYIYNQVYGGMIDIDVLRKIMHKGVKDCVLDYTRINNTYIVLNSKYKMVKCYKPYCMYKSTCPFIHGYDELKESLVTIPPIRVPSINMFPIPAPSITVPSIRISPIHASTDITRFSPHRPSRLIRTDNSLYTRHGFDNIPKDYTFEERGYHKKHRREQEHRREPVQEQEHQREPVQEQEVDKKDAKIKQLESVICKMRTNSTQTQKQIKKYISCLASARIEREESSQENKQLLIINKKLKQDLTDIKDEDSDKLTNSIMKLKQQSLELRKRNLRLSHEVFTLISKLNIPARKKRSRDDTVVISTKRSKRSKRSTSVYFFLKLKQCL